MLMTSLFPAKMYGGESSNGVREVGTGDIYGLHEQTVPRKSLSTAVQLVSSTPNSPSNSELTNGLIH